MDFGETYALVGKLTTFWYLISLVGNHWGNFDHLDVVTAFCNPEVDNDHIYMPPVKGWLQGMIAPTMVVRLKKAIYYLNQAPRLCHNDIIIIFLSLEFKQALPHPNLYLRCYGILML
jgi:hypothetical protein